jgi:hypothetical protein
MLIGLTVLIVNMPLDAVIQKRQQVKQTKDLVRMFLPVSEVVLQIISVVF